MPASPSSPRKLRRLLLAALPAGVILGVVLLKAWEFRPRVPMDQPSPLATWPLPGAVKDNPVKGVTHWFAAGKDGTTVDFADFDFGANPKLRWEIADQDEDDATPYDNRVLFWDRDVAAMVRQLNASGRGPVIAASNGAFFGYDKNTAAFDAFHLSPVVLRGKALYLNSNHRWTFGVKYINGSPRWNVFYKPDKTTLEREFDFAAGSVQCLIKDGKPLLVEPFPKPGQPFKKPPVPSSPSEAGHIPGFDHMLSCRNSLAWSQDSRHLYWLGIKEPDDEGSSIQAVNDHVYKPGGWTLADVQRSGWPTAAPGERSIPMRAT